MERVQGARLRRVVPVALSGAAVAVMVLAVISWGTPMRVVVPLGASADVRVGVDGGLVTLAAVTGREPIDRASPPATVPSEVLRDEVGASTPNPIVSQPREPLVHRRWFGFTYRSSAVPRWPNGGGTMRTFTVPAWLFFFLFIAWPAFAFYAAMSGKPRSTAAGDRA